MKRSLNPVILETLEDLFNWGVEEKARLIAKIGPRYPVMVRDKLVICHRVNEMEFVTLGAGGRRILGIGAHPSDPNRLPMKLITRRTIEALLELGWSHDGWKTRSLHMMTDQDGRSQLVLISAAKIRSLRKNLLEHRLSPVIVYHPTPGRLKGLERHGVELRRLHIKRLEKP